MLADAARRGSIRMSADPASSRARTETLYALEAVAERNRPVAPPKKPEAAPFFLPSEMDAQRRDAAPPPALPPPPPEDDAFAGDDGSDADGSDADGAVADAAAEASRCRLAALSLAEDATAVATCVEIKIWTPDALVDFHTGCYASRRARRLGPRRRDRAPVPRPPRRAGRRARSALREAPRQDLCGNQISGAHAMDATCFP